MARDEVSWIRILVAEFDDPRWLIIESYPEIADSVEIIYIKMCLLAGKCNAQGLLVLPNGAPYTSETLAAVLRRQLPSIKTALTLLQQHGFVEMVEDAMAISSWQHTQYVDDLKKLADKRAKDAERKRHERLATKQKYLPPPASTDASVDGPRMSASKNKNKKQRLETTTTDVVVVSLETVLDELPARYRDQTSVKKLIATTLESHDEEYVLSNVRYSLRNAKTNFVKYLSDALAKDWAEEERIKEKQARLSADLAREQKAQKAAADAEQEEEFRRRVEEAWASMDESGREIVNAETNGFVAEWELDPASPAAKSAWMNSVAKIAGIEPHN